MDAVSKCESGVGDRADTDPSLEDAREGMSAESEISSDARALLGFVDRRGLELCALCSVEGFDPWGLDGRSIAEVISTGEDKDDVGVTGPVAVSSRWSIEGVASEWLTRDAGNGCLVLRCGCCIEEPGGALEWPGMPLW